MVLWYYIVIFVHIHDKVTPVSLLTQHLFFTRSSTPTNCIAFERPLSALTSDVSILHKG